MICADGSLITSCVLLLSLVIADRKHPRRRRSGMLVVGALLAYNGVGYAFQLGWFGISGVEMCLALHDRHVNMWLSGVMLCIVAYLVVTQFAEGVAERESR